MGELILRALIIAICSYFLGCFNGSVIVSKYIFRNDIRKHGSGNAGLTNFYRVFGGPLTVVVIATDFLKAVVALLLGAWLIADSSVGILAADPALLGKYWAALFCLLGHMFPCMFEFKGGKGILSGGAVLIMLDWRIALISWGGFLILVALTRWVSLGSVWASGILPFTTWFFFQNPVLTALGLVCGWLVVWKHKDNIGRILKGSERKLTFRSKKKGE